MIVSYIVTFVCIWWLLFFMSLPIGIEANEKVGIEGSPPKKTHLKLKLLITTLITPILTYAFCSYFNSYLENLL